MSTKTTVPKPFMSNGAKLVIIVLSFFLALTFVRALTLESDSSEVIFSGNQPYSFSIAVTNTSNVPISPNFVADGPFSIILPADAPSSISAHDSKSFVLKLVPSTSFRVGDVYSAQIRFVSSLEEKSLPLTMRMKTAPLFSSSPGTGLFSIVSFVSLPSLSNVSLMDVLLIVIVVILGIALAARVKNRVMGG